MHFDVDYIRCRLSGSKHKNNVSNCRSFEVQLNFLFFFLDGQIVSGFGFHSYLTVSLVAIGVYRTEDQE